ncbi:hypothetical protein RJ035_005119 [Blastomyces gilchristii]
MGGTTSFDRGEVRIRLTAQLSSSAQERRIKPSGNSQKTAGWSKKLSGYFFPNPENDSTPDGRQFLKLGYVRKTGYASPQDNNSQLLRIDVIGIYHANNLHGASHEEHSKATEEETLNIQMHPLQRPSRSRQAGSTKYRVPPDALRHKGLGLQRHHFRRSPSEIAPNRLGSGQ